MRCLLILISLACAGVWPIAAQTLPESTLNFTFRDEVTGIAVRPMDVVLTPRQQNIDIIRISEQDINVNRVTPVRLSDATWDIDVNATGYEPMHTWFDLHGQTVNATFQLVPIKKDPRADTAYINSKRRTNMLLISGYVTDKVSGLPLRDMGIRPGRGGTAYRTDSMGYFAIYMPLGKDSSLAASGNHILFYGQGYRTHVVKNFDEWSGGDLWLKIALSQGKGTDSVNVLQRRAPSLELMK